MQWVLGRVCAGLVAQGSRPLQASRFDGLQLVGGDAVSSDLCDLETAGGGELLGEHAGVETGVAFGGRREQLVITEPTRRSDRVNVEVVARPPGVQRGDLVADRIGQAEHRADVQRYELAALSERRSVAGGSLYGDLGRSVERPPAAELRPARQPVTAGQVA